MAPPSYARATAASSLKATGSPSSASKSQGPKIPTSTPKKLKRPSTLTPKHRQSIRYNADLYPISPQDATKPCPLATLPSELRTTIYQYTLEPHHALPQPQFVIRPGGTRVSYIWPTILHISRAIRIEAAYVYYSSTAFTFTVRNLDFSKIVFWIERLPSKHRALLTRNQQLCVKIIPGLRQGYSYPPPGWLLDAWMDQHWKDCSAFGNVYTVPTIRHQTHFILFCRLLGWFQLCSSKQYSGVKWKYVFDSSFPKSIWEQCSSAEMLYNFLRDQVGVLGMGCVARAWTRGRLGGRGRDMALMFLKDLDDTFVRVSADSREGLVDDWDWEMRRLRRVVETW